ncbi:MAG: hypothetical protein P4M09_14305 [Devosia sp.]|nr:hypothetical protein [Devosia sp.]
MRAYASYRDSGIELIGRVPSHWSSSRLRFAVQLNPSKSEVAHRDRSEEVSFVPMDAVGEDGSLRLDQTRTIGEVETGYTYFRDGDVVVAKITPCFENGKGAIMRGLVGGVGFGTTELIVARPRGQISAAYIYWLFNSVSFRKLGEGAMYGAGGQKRVPEDFVRDFAVALPPPPEQAAIAAFLDRETGKIDALVEEQRRLIELLKEKRQTVISHAVTKGLDPTAPMKDSGVEWLGQVPAHWNVMPFKCAATILPGYAFPSSGFTKDPQHVRLLRGVNVDVGSVRWDEAVYWDRAVADGLDAFVLYPGEIVLGMDRPWIGDGLRIAMIEKGDTPSLLLQRVAAVKPRAANCGRYLYLLLGLPAFFHHCAPEMTGVSVPHISGSQVEDYVVAVPPEAEQLAIAEHVQTRTISFDELIAEAEAAVTLLQERRSALISAAVTGKIDVRGLGPSVKEDAYAA